MVETLNSFGVDLNESNIDKNYSDTTALMWAILKKQLEVAKKILESD